MCDQSISSARLNIGMIEGTTDMPDGSPSNSPPLKCGMAGES